MKDDRLSKVVIFAHPSETNKKKTRRPQMDWEEALSEDLKVEEERTQIFGLVLQWVFSSDSSSSSCLC